MCNLQRDLRSAFFYCCNFRKSGVNGCDRHTYTSVDIVDSDCENPANAGRSLQALATTDAPTSASGVLTSLHMTFDDVECHASILQNLMMHGSRCMKQIAYSASQQPRLLSPMSHSAPASMCLLRRLWISIVSSSWKHPSVPSWLLPTMQYWKGAEPLSQHACNSAEL